MHSTLLYPGAYARKPLCNRIPLLDSAIGVDYIYGVSDWMDYRSALAVRWHELCIVSVVSRCVCVVQGSAASRATPIFRDTSC